MKVSEHVKLAVAVIAGLVVEKIFHFPLMIYLMLIAAYLMWNHRKELRTAAFATVDKIKAFFAKLF